MSIEQSLDRIATALEALANLKTPSESAATAAPVTQKRGPGRPPKAVTPSATETADTAASAPPAPSAMPMTANLPAPTPVPAPAAIATSAVTKEMVSNQMVKLIKANLRDTVVKILGEHGAGSISTLEPTEYEAVYAKAVKATPAEA